MATKLTHLQDKSRTWQLFNDISSSYDLLNHLLSFGIDRYWRRRVAKEIKGKGLRYVDLGTGTADFIIALIQKLGRETFSSIIGIDPAEKMLAVGRTKLLEDWQVTLETGDATALSLPSNESDLVTMSFAIRNVPDVRACLSEMCRILDHKGKAMILEFSIPKNPVIRAGYLLYFRHVLPFLGGLISGNPQAYRYLNKSVEDFPYGDDFCKIMKESGFQQVTAKPLSFGIATLYIGEMA